MGHRTNALALRVHKLIHWPSNVRHYFLTNYVKHIFQHQLVGEPGIRASTNGIWINVTLLNQSGAQNVNEHPRVLDPVLELRDYKIDETQLGRWDAKMSQKAQYHKYYKNAFANVPIKSLVQAMNEPDPVTGKPKGGAATTTLAALQIYKDVPIHLKINIIKNPLMNAQVCADYIAKQMEAGRPLSRVYKSLLSKLS
ncbi:hypothetical protein HK097_001504 [Rhizophlyctis rosea]|uniref:Uncharacterized protein n=1 Tax=Rhizophlyctis rosea TaxID=64517 RepID=A0AAD5SKZ7_9FUNG|nr:hypothetical protein HK097_001504 [Rhizophlyctis rosea]